MLSYQHNLYNLLHANFFFRWLRGEMCAQRRGTTRPSAAAWRPLVWRSTPSNPTQACRPTTHTLTLSASRKCLRRLQRRRKAWGTWNATSSRVAKMWQHCCPFMRRRRVGIKRRTRASPVTWATSAGSCNTLKLNARRARRRPASLRRPPTS